MSKMLAKNLVDIVNSLENQTDKEKYIERISRGDLTIDENPKDHFVVAFVLFDLVKRKVFIGHHKKSDRWMFPGGHVERSELLLEAAKREMKEELGLEIALGEPLLITKTPIDNPGSQKCKLHYDIWYFVLVDSDSFTLNVEKYSVEFYEAGWKTFSKARKLITIPSYLEPIDYIEKYLL